jgi:hypothetical protein
MADGQKVRGRPAGPDAAAATCNVGFMVWVHIRDQVTCTELGVRDARRAPDRPVGSHAADKIINVRVYILGQSYSLCHTHKVYVMDTGWAVPSHPIAASEGVTGISILQHGLQTKLYGTVHHKECSLETQDPRARVRRGIHTCPTAVKSPGYQNSCRAVCA